MADLVGYEDSEDEPEMEPGSAGGEDPPVPLTPEEVSAGKILVAFLLSSVTSFSRRSSGRK